MRKRLIANGCLSLLNLILNIAYISLFAFYVSSNWEKAIWDIWEQWIWDNFSTSVPLSITGLYFLVVACSTANLVMGIVTLAMEKHIAAHSLTIASGVLGILSGLFGINAIVSFLAASKIKKSEIKSDSNPIPPRQKNQEQSLDRQLGDV